MTTTLEKEMKKLLTYAAAAGCLVAFASAADARSAYDGSWDLVFVTQRGACDATYNFSVNITDGIVTHPNLVRFRGYVARSEAVRASVTVQDKYASGSGKLSGVPAEGPGVAIQEARAAPAIGRRSEPDLNALLLGRGARPPELHTFANVKCRFMGHHRDP
jgi:hypothetical protein